MVDETIGETIAVNLVPDPRLTHVIPGGVNVVQAVLSGGTGVSLERGAGSGDSYVTPWADAEHADGDRVGVLIVQSNALEPYDGVSMDAADGPALVWLRGASTGYAEVMAVRCHDPSKVRLRAPRSGVLTVIKSGVFDLDSWTAMQERNIIYFDGDGLVQASESGYTLPPATTTTLGGVIVGDGLTVSAQGVLSVLERELPIATQDTAGVVKAGNGVRVKSDGTLEVRLGKNLSFDTSGNIDAAGGSQSVDLSDYYTRTEVDGKFLTKELAEATYATKDSLEGLSDDLTALENRVNGMGSGGGGGGGEFNPDDYYTKTEADDRFFTNAASDARIPYFFRCVTVSQNSDGNAMVQVAFTRPSGASGNPWVFVNDNYLQNDTLQKTGTWKLWAIGSGTFTLRFTSYANGGNWATGAQPCRCHVLLVWGG